MAPLIVAFPDPVISNVRPVPINSDKNTLPPSVVLAVLSIDNVWSPPELVKVPLIVRSFEPAMLVLARSTALFEMALGTPAAMIVDPRRFNTLVPNAALFPMAMVPEKASVPPE